MTRFVFCFYFVPLLQEASTLLPRLGDSGTTQNIVSTIKGDNTINSTPEEATLEESFPPTRNVIPGV